MAPEALRKKLIIVGRECDKITRQAGNIELSSRRTSSAQRSLFYEGVKMYNALPFEIKQCDRLLSYKRLLKVYVLSNVL